MTRRRPNVLFVVGSLGMVVFFGSLLVFGDREDVPAWILWPAAGAMLVFVPLGWWLDWRTNRSARHQ